MITKQYKYYQELILAKKIVKNSYKKICLKNKMDVKDKGSKDIVTNIDVMTEQYLINTIKSKYPQDIIVSEEGNPTAKVQGRSWIIDPIDGTINFAKDIELWGTQLAFAVDGKPEFCVMYLPYIDELYYAAIGQGAYLNDQPLPKHQPCKVEDYMALLDYSLYMQDFALKDTKPLFDSCMRLRMLGSSCYSFCKVAKGDFSTFVLYCKNPWDYIPGTILCQETGAIAYYKTSGEQKCHSTLVTFCTDVPKMLKFTKKMYK